MNYIRSNKATDWETPGILNRIVIFLTYPFQANPDYESKLHLVKEWLIEFEEDGSPWREIGLSINEKPIIAGPDKRNYGFWLDTNMNLIDFDGSPIEADYFEAKWNDFWKNRKYVQPT